MHDEWQPPPVPNVREDAGAKWRDLWDRAHVEMRPYGRRPSMHLVDRLVGYADRQWLRDQLGAIALVTLRETGHRDDHDRMRWTIRLTNPATMRREPVRVVFDATSGEIVNAFPETSGRSRHADRR